MCECFFNYRPTLQSVFSDRRCTPCTRLSLTYGVLDLDATCKTMCDCTGKKKSEECTDDEILLWICPNACQRKRSKDRTYYVEALNFLVGGETANYTTLSRGAVLFNACVWHR